MANQYGIVESFSARPSMREISTWCFGVLPSKYSGSVAGLQYGLGKAKLFLREEKNLLYLNSFFQNGGFPIFLWRIPIY